MTLNINVYVVGQSVIWTGEILPEQMQIIMLVFGNKFIWLCLIRLKQIDSKRSKAIPAFINIVLELEIDVRS